MLRLARSLGVALFLLAPVASLASTEALAQGEDAGTDTEEKPEDAENGDGDEQESATEEATDPTDGGLTALETESGALKVGGYIQSRFQKADGDESTFLIRRARIKTAFVTEHTELMVHIDAVPSRIRLHEGWVGFTEPFTGTQLVRVRFGMMDVPFGYSVPSSTTKRVFVERSPIAGALFPGEKDLGFFADGRWLGLRVAAAVVNGQFREGLYYNDDPTTPKNVVGRVGLDLGWIYAGASGYAGDAAFPDPAGSSPGDTVRGDRFRYGADFGVTADLVPLIGPSTLRIEFMQGRDNDADIRGGYTALEQELVYGFTLGLRYNIVDFEQGATELRMTALDAALLYQLNKHFKVTLQGTLNREDANVKNDVLTLQVQAKY